MDVRITPRRLSGVVTPPPSKSLAHRYVIAAALAAGTSVIQNVSFSEDVEATLRCMEALGAVGGRGGRPPHRRHRRPAPPLRGPAPV